MKILIKQARIVDPSSPHSGTIKDIFIRDGKIVQISSQLQQEADRVIECDGLHVSPGWVDTFSHFCDPGSEYKETLETGSKAAAAGGFTHVFVLPNTQPAVHSKSQVEYIKEKSKSLPVNLHPIGAITRNTEGKELAEMYDMKASGAIAFSDGLNTVQSAGLLIKALQYVKAIDGIIIQVPDDKSIAPHGLMNEGIISTRLGLPGKPAMAEELMVARDIKLARYTDSKLHFAGVTSRKSLEYIKRAKEGGIKVTCSVTPYHLYFTEEDLMTYDTNLKVNLPLRSKEDSSALKNALLDGTVDMVATHHEPHEWDSKVCEFEYAKPGMIGLESCYAALGSLGFSAVDTVKWLSINPGKIFGLPQVCIKEGEPCDITLFQPGVTFTFEERHIQSKSKNTAFLGKELKGKVIGTIIGEKLSLNPTL
jgi:dihydroorotase